MLGFRGGGLGFGGTVSKKFSRNRASGLWV